nr:MAG TPA: hypothetical protein [Caudoviricetes sp.]
MLRSFHIPHDSDTRCWVNQGRRNTTLYNHPYSNLYYKHHPAMRKPCNRLLLIPLPLFLKYYLPYYLHLSYAKVPGTDPGPYPHTYDYDISFHPAKVMVTILTN